MFHVEHGWLRAGDCGVHYVRTNPSNLDTEVDMSASKARVPKLGRGLKSLMSTPVKVQVEPVAEPEAEEKQGGDAGPATAATESAKAPAAEAAPAPATTDKAPASDTVKHAPEMPSAPPVSNAQAPAGAAQAPAESAAKSLRIPPGRGYNPPTSQPKAPAPVGAQAGLVYLPVASLRPNRHQPRQQFDENSLNRLADSIRSEGIMQPIVARPDGQDTGRYEVVAGERRWRAAKIAGLATVPVIVRDLNDRQLAEWALIENLQREDLNPIERAEAFSRLIDQFGLSHEEAGERIGMDRSTITNHLRLLTLCDTVKQLIREGLISMGQARALAGLSDESQQKMLAERAVRQGMSVREVEAAVRKLTETNSASPKAASSSGKAPFLADLERQIAQQLGTKVTLKPGRKKGTGTLSIDFYSLDQFDALVTQLGVKTD